MKPTLKLKERIHKDRLTIGLDIGTSAVKFVQLRFSQDKVELVDFALEPVQEDLIAHLKRIAPSQIVNISVSGVSTIIRYIDLPKMNEDELKQALNFEVQKYIPFPINEVIMDSYILKENQTDNKMLVLIAAVKQGFINERLKLIHDAGMKVKMVDLDSIALVNAFKFNYPPEQEANIANKAIALLNVGASISSINILEGGIPVLSRDIYIAGNNLTGKTQGVLGMDSKPAQELKTDTGKEKSSNEITAAESILSNLAKEIRVSFDFYENQSASSVSKIFLSGGGSKFPGLKDTLATLLGIETEHWDPLRQLSIAENINSDNLKASSAQLAVAIGLALRE